MSENQKTKQNLLHTLYKQKTRATQASSPQGTSNQNEQLPSVQIVESPDMKRTRTRYRDAVKFLQDAIQAHGGESWQGIQLSKLEGELQDVNESQIKKHIDEALQVQNI